MPRQPQPTIERLDRPSAYYLGRVSLGFPEFTAALHLANLQYQNKKRKFGREDEDFGKADGEPEDPLKDATTLYVGNLYAAMLSINFVQF